MSLEMMCFLLILGMITHSTVVAWQSTSLSMFTSHIKSPPLSRTRMHLAQRYEDTDTVSKGLVSSLTGLLNRLASPSSSQELEVDPLSPPKSAKELGDRIQKDYTENNYLWTGNIDTACFQSDCRFKDPTLSFEGLDTFVENVGNLRPIVDKWVTNSQSILLDCQVTGEYVQTRWNMRGDLNVPWSPRIDVVGRTKFWYRTDGGSPFQVYYYDEEWEIPAWKALLQIVTPAGTIPNAALDDENS